MLHHSLFLKACVVIGLFALLTIPMMMVKGQVQERGRLRAEVVSEIANSYSQQQTVSGPVIYVPYSQTFYNQEWNKELKRYEEKKTVQRNYLIITPENLDITATVETEMRHRGIYGAPVYKSRSTFKGAFRIPDSLPVYGNALEVGAAFMVVAVADMRGIVSVPKIRILDQVRTMSLGMATSGLDKHSMSLELGAIPDLLGTTLPFEFELDIKGSQRLGFLPIAGAQSLKVSSTWPHPSFNGLMLPESHDITAEGFSAIWRTNALASATAISCIKKEVSCVNSGYALNVDFIEPVTGHSSVERTVKYSHLFVLIIFAAFLLYEVLKKLRIHGLQYILVGLAQAMFFLLLLALSEHIAFSLAYLVAAISCISLIGFYIRHVLDSAKSALLLSFALTLVYGVLYMTLLSEDFAFLMGSVLLFALLAAIMIMTRKVDWYGYSDALREKVLESRGMSDAASEESR
jgi:inner membrane protein